MLKTFPNVINKNIRFFYKSSFYRFDFSRKNLKTSNISISEPFGEGVKGEEYREESGNKLDYIKVYHGTYPYMPLDDHPLIPGYARMLAVSREIIDKLKEANVEKTKMVMSVLKNPEKVEALQASM
jgi:hypothetical protein